MSDRLTATGILSTKRLTNSRNGNPRYSVTLMLGTGVARELGLDYATVNGKTAADSSFLFAMPRSGKALCTWHETPSGRIVFDDIRKA